MHETHGWKTGSYPLQHCCFKHFHLGHGSRVLGPQKGSQTKGEVQSWILAACFWPKVIQSSTQELEDSQHRWAHHLPQGYQVTNAPVWPHTSHFIRATRSRTRRLRPSLVAPLDLTSRCMDMAPIVSSVE